MEIDEWKKSSSSVIDAKIHQTDETTTTKIFHFPILTCDSISRSKKFEWRKKFVFFFMDFQLIFSRLSQSWLNFPKTSIFSPFHFRNFSIMSNWSSPVVYVYEKEKAVTQHISSTNWNEFIKQTDQLHCNLLATRHHLSGRERELESKINLPVVTCECAKW